ncbi:MAG TPA: hypothetical protein VFW06_07030 [Acidimicrobiia bacterium]|nr:hypothetical protein [Acidimicrobiia bacterium]
MVQSLMSRAGKIVGGILLGALRALIAVVEPILGIAIFIVVMIGVAIWSSLWILGFFLIASPAIFGMAAGGQAFGSWGALIGLVIGVLATAQIFRLVSSWWDKTGAYWWIDHRPRLRVNRKPEDTLRTGTESDGPIHPQ